MANIAQQKTAPAQNRKSFNKNASTEKEIRNVDGHKTTVIRGEKTTVFWKGMEVTSDTHSRPRVGKTARDKANGAQRRNYENKQSRASWSNDSKRSISNFPYNSCNGKKNRTVVTGKGNERITIAYKMSK